MSNKKKIAQLTMIYVPLTGLVVAGFLKSWQITLVAVGICIFIAGAVSWANDNL